MKEWILNRHLTLNMKRDQYHATNFLKWKEREPLAVLTLALSVCQQRILPLLLDIKISLQFEMLVCVCVFSGPFMHACSSTYPAVLQVQMHNSHSTLQMKKGDFALQPLTFFVFQITFDLCICVYMCVCVRLWVCICECVYCVPLYAYESELGMDQGMNRNCRN